MELLSRTELQNIITEVALGTELSPDIDMELLNDLISSDVTDLAGEGLFSIEGGITRVIEGIFNYSGLKVVPRFYLAYSKEYAIALSDFLEFIANKKQEEITEQLTEFKRKFGSGITNYENDDFEIMPFFDEEEEINEQIVNCLVFNDIIVIFAADNEKENIFDDTLQLGTFEYSELLALGLTKDSLEEFYNTMCVKVSKSTLVS